MRIFFFTRLLILISSISLTAVWAYGLEGFKTNTGGLVFNVVFYSFLALTVYFFVLFIASISASLLTSSNRFPLNFYTVSLADMFFSYSIILSSSLLFLTESESTVSVGVSEGELIINGLRTILGWRHASESARGAICFAIVLHFLFFIHSYIALKTRPIVKR